jgi:hypothetical protein
MVRCKVLHDRDAAEAGEHEAEHLGVSSFAEVEI